MRDYRINAHGHLLPYPEQIPQFMKDQKVFWIDTNRQFMYQQNWSRPITDTSFFISEKLAWMEKNKIDHEVILNLSQLYCNGYSRELALDVIRFQNDFNANVQEENLDKITAGFVVQAAYTDDALNEMERCVNRGMHILCLPTHFLKNDQWTSIADESVEPIFELANEFGLAVEIHPYDGEKMIGLANTLWRFHLVWMCAQTADTYHMFTSKSYHKKYPQMRVCFAHGNQFGQVNVGRRQQGFKGRPDLFEGTSSPLDAVGNKNIFFDTLVHDIFSFRLLKERQGIHQIVAGLDDPYPLGEMESVPDCYPGKVIDDALEAGFIDKKEKQMIWKENVLNWIAGPDQTSYKSRLKIDE